jgi:hypothetical protein
MRPCLRTESPTPAPNDNSTYISWHDATVRSRRRWRVGGLLPTRRGRGSEAKSRTSVPSYRCEREVRRGEDPRSSDVSHAGRRVSMEARFSTIVQSC